MTAAVNSQALDALTKAIRRRNSADEIRFQTQYQLPLCASDDEIIVDYFCGGGGAGTGLEMGLGRAIAIAKNHNPQAISLHQANHPQAIHLATDVFSGDPRIETGGRRVGWFHMSPDCTHFSQAAGGQPRKKAIRDLSWVGCKWAGMVRPRVISLENVKQIMSWSPLIAKRDKETGRVIKLVPYFSKGKERVKQVVALPGERVPVGQQYLIPDPKRKGETWRRFVRQLEGLGYAVEWRVLAACDYGAPTTRKRLYMIARCDGNPIVWPEPTHALEPKAWQEPWRGAHECIDWSIPSQSIFGRPTPYADATLRRVAKGTVTYVLKNADPFILPIANWSAGSTVQSVREPLRTITAWPKGGAFAAVSPVLAPMAAQSDSNHGPLPEGAASRAGELALFASYMVQANGGYNVTVGRDLRSPVSAITRTGSQQQLLTAQLAGLNQAGVGISLDDPTNPTMSYSLSPEHEAGALKVSAFLMQYYSTGGQWGAVTKPLNTITTKDRLALVTVILGGSPYVIVDIRLRMLQPHELYAAQGFPDNYEIARGHDGREFSKKDQVRMCGNSVPPPVIRALAAANDPWRQAALEANRKAMAA
ncbi:DNA cytosine methyltransferase [Pseudomonas corrugata]|uniref:DNA cytosine methyltransferase n=1 Tax=Pseudomonas corrugata TaxID=47879 RepID=UPI0018E5F0F2|nr:DNA cytosine methyltransferase [Pseudomonas corrugata]MBI6621558.1 DNA cytosine methyltransferase [Pseudomonas corrugata]MBI6694207.1 DNA cytosine methyltransferase [Pseudomonas corrugata]